MWMHLPKSLSPSYPSAPASECSTLDFDLLSLALEAERLVVGAVIWDSPASRFSAPPEGAPCKEGPPCPGPAK